MSQVGGAMVQAGVISVEQLASLGVTATDYGNNLLTIAEAVSEAVAAIHAQEESLRSQQASGALTAGQTADGLRYAGQVV